MIGSGAQHPFRDWLRVQPPNRCLTFTRRPWSNMHRLRFFSSFLFTLATSTTAYAKIPDFGIETAPELIKQSPNPKAREFYAELVKDTKQQARQMVEDTKKTTGLTASKLKKLDWDCLFWRVAATSAKNLRRRFPGLQPPEFADLMEQTALDGDDCPDEGGPGSAGVKVYNAAINQVQASRGGWQKSAATGPDFIRTLAAILGAGVDVGEAVPAGAPATPGLWILLGNPEDYLPTPMRKPKQGEMY